MCVCVCPRTTLCVCGGGVLEVWWVGAGGAGGCCGGGGMQLFSVSVRHSYTVVSLPSCFVRLWVSRVCGH